MGFLELENLSENCYSESIKRRIREEVKMKCPNCKKEIDYVLVYVEAFKKGHLVGKTNQVGIYEPVKVLESTPTLVTCSKCGGEIDARFVKI